MCCKTYHDWVIWINVGLAIELVVFGIFSFINVFRLLSTGVIVELLFPIYFVYVTTPFF
jgi:hypothetical protein